MVKGKTVILQQKISEFFQNILEQNLGSSFNSVLNFYFRQKFGCDPYELFWKNPYVFYTTLKEIFGGGAEAIISLIAENLREKYPINLTSKEIIQLMKSRSKQSKIKLQNILKKVVNLKL